MSASWPCPEPEDARHLQAVLAELGQRPQPPRLVTSPEALAALEHAMRQRTAHLGSLLVGAQMQRAVAAAVLPAAQERWGRPWPQPLQHNGQVRVRSRTAPGRAGPGRGTSSRRQGQRRAGQRSAGV